MVVLFVLNNFKLDAFLFFYLQDSVETSEPVKIRNRILECL